MRYRWEIKTSDTWYAGTDASVFLSLSGLNASMREVQISDPEVINDWEQGEINHGLIETEDLGELQTGTLRHDQSGPAAGWSVDWVKVSTEDDGREWTATVGRFDEGGRFPLLRFSRTKDGVRDPSAPAKPTSPAAEQAVLFLASKGWRPEQIERFIQGPEKGEATPKAVAPSSSTGLVHHFVTLVKQAAKGAIQGGDDEDEKQSDDAPVQANLSASGKVLEHHFVTLKKSKTTD